MHFDFSGKLDLHVLGPTPDRLDETPSTMALIRTRQRLWPELFVGLRYDLARSNVGITAVLTSLRWRRPPMLRHPFFNFFWPTSLNIAAEQGLLEAYTSSSLAIQWQNPEEPSMTSAIRADFDSKQSAISLVMPLHRRLSYECQFVSDIQLPPPTTIGDAWWMPDLSLGANGRLESKSSAVLHHPLRDRDARLGVRLAAGRSLMNFAGEPTTSLRLELTDMLPTTVTGVRLQAELEHPLDSLRLSIVQQVAAPVPILPKIVIERGEAQ